MAFLPIVERELRVAARRPETYRARWVVAGAGVLLWLGLMVFTQQNGTIQSLGQTIFTGLGAFIFACALLAGVFLTADCLGSEKREGTLGLLLLADLRPLEIILGKLAASSLQGACGLLTLLPLLALPLLMGGVTGGAWWRLCLALLVTLFFSLSAGMLASAVCRETHHAMLLTLAVLLVFAGVGPAVAWVFVPKTWAHLCHQALVLPSPGFLLIAGRDYMYSSRWGWTQYWLSAGIILTLGASFLAAGVALLAGGRVARRLAAWREGAGAWFDRHCQEGARHRRQCAPLLAQNPIQWLAARDGSAGRLAWLPAAAMGLVVAVFAMVAQIDLRAHNIAGKYLALSLMLGYLAHQGFKLLVALEATRQLAEDRATGHLELLLITPLTERQLLAGHLQALRGQFRYPERAMALGNFLLFLLFTFCARELSINNSEHPVFIMGSFGGMLALWLDNWALRWMGLWQALRAPTRYRAVFSCAVRLLAPGWLGLFFAVFLVYSSNPSSEKINFGVFLWLLGSLACSVVCGWRARRRLCEGFRQTRETGAPPPR